MTTDWPDEKALEIWPDILNPRQPVNMAIGKIAKVLREACERGATDATAAAKKDAGK